MKNLIGGAIAVLFLQGCATMAPPDYSKLEADLDPLLQSPHGARFTRLWNCRSRSGLSELMISCSNHSHPETRSTWRWSTAHTFALTCTA